MTTCEHRRYRGRQGAVWRAAGLAGGALGTILVLRILRRLLDEVPPFDPIALGIAIAIMVGCAAAALPIPVHRAIRMDPIVTLRAKLNRPCCRAAWA